MNAANSAATVKSARRPQRRQPRCASVSATSEPGTKKTMNGPIRSNGASPTPRCTSIRRRDARRRQAKASPAQAPSAANTRRMKPVPPTLSFGSSPVSERIQMRATMATASPSAAPRQTYPRRACVVEARYGPARSMKLARRRSCSGICMRNLLATVVVRRV